MYSPSMGATLSHMEIADDIKYIDETLETPIIRFQVQDSSAKKLLKKFMKKLLLIILNNFVTKLM
ncbi:hypothetical protein HC766_05255 [Candidatus Gracilibacteria bacterium]|nr:hypothetical protein [Candidatus Gracilibacteria bacterium]